jgi:hypothetical protein
MKNNLFAILFTLLIFTWGTAHGTLFTVDARLHSATLGQEPNNTPGGGLDTGIYLSAGQTIIVTANPNDLWSAGDIPRWSNADGLTYDLKATLGDESGKAPGTLIGQDWGLLTQSGLAAPFGALVGEVGGTFFLLEPISLARCRPQAN